MSQWDNIAPAGIRVCYIWRLEVADGLGEEPLIGAWEPADSPEACCSSCDTQFTGEAHFLRQGRHAATPSAQSQIRWPLQTLRPHRHHLHRNSRNRAADGGQTGLLHAEPRMCGNAICSNELHTQDVGCRRLILLIIYFRSNTVFLLHFTI